MEENLPRFSQTMVGMNSTGHGRSVAFDTLIAHQLTNAAVQKRLRMLCRKAIAPLWTFFQASFTLLRIPRCQWSHVGTHIYLVFIPFRSRSFVCCAQTACSGQSPHSGSRKTSESNRTCISGHICTSCFKGEVRPNEIVILSGQPWNSITGSLLTHQKCKS